MSRPYLQGRRKWRSRRARERIISHRRRVAHRLMERYMREALEIFTMPQRLLWHLPIRSSQ